MTSLSVSVPVFNLPIQSWVCTRSRSVSLADSGRKKSPRLAILSEISFFSIRRYFCEGKTCAPRFRS